jgi:hypothetical protein
VHIEVTTDWDLARHLGVPQPAVAAAIELNRQLAAGTVTWAPYADDVVMPTPGTFCRPATQLAGLRSA